MKKFFYVSNTDSPLEKAQICKKLKIDIMIEDEPENINEISKISRVICFIADYNENVCKDIVMQFL